MKIYSGPCCLCDCGIPTNIIDDEKNPLFSGDIVHLWYRPLTATVIDPWFPENDFTAIVGNQYRSFLDGSIMVINNNPRLYTMGIKNFGVQGGPWKVVLIKSHRDIIPGEKIKPFGFNWR